jgi:membrane associated rhomboid family serine protease
MRFPLVTLLLILATVAAYGLELAAGGFSACEAYGLVPAKFAQTGNLTPIFTALFLHDPGHISHLAGNMTFLLLFGAVVEGELGGLALFLLYGLAGLAGGLLHVLVDPSAVEPLVGASGAIFGVLAVAAALRPPLLGFALGFGALNIYHALTGGSAGVSFAAHLGGLAAGALVAMVLRIVDVDALPEAA